MTEGDLCDLWLAQAWVDLKAPLAQRGGGTLSSAVDAEAARDLLQALCRGDIQAAHRVCRRWHGLGHEPPEMSQALALILPVIEHIEHDWQADRRSYADTLYAFWNVQRFLQSWGDPACPQSDAPPLPATPMGRLLMASVPGCQHHLGALVVADHFRTHGWQVQTLIGACADRLIQAGQQERFDVIGLSLGHDAGLLGLADLIQSLRDAIPESPPRIVLGGHAFSASGVDFEWLRADGIARSAQHALRLCGAWVPHQHH